MNGGMNIHKSYMYELYWVELPGIPWFVTQTAIFSIGVFSRAARSEKTMGKIRVCADPETSIQAWYCTSRWQQSQRPFFPRFLDDLTDGFLDEPIIGEPMI